MRWPPGPGEISEMCQAETVLGTLTEVEHVAGCRLREIDLGSGMVARASVPGEPVL